MDPTQNNPFDSFGAGGSPVNGGARPVFPGTQGTVPGGNYASGTSGAGFTSQRNTGGTYPGVSSNNGVVGSSSVYNPLNTARAGYSSSSNMQRGGYINNTAMGIGSGITNQGMVATNVNATSYNAPVGRSRKGLAVVLVVFLLLVIGGVGAWAYFSSGSKGGGGVASEDSVKSAYNEYINYVIYNKEGSEDFDIDDAVSQTPYYYQIGGDERKAFLEKAETKYQSLVDKYYKIGGSYNIGDVKAFYQDLGLVVDHSLEEILNSYQKSGWEATEEMIDSISENIDNDSAVAGAYVIALVSYEKSLLKIVDSASLLGCSSGLILDGSCSGIPEEDLTVYSDAYYGLEDAKKDVAIFGTESLKLSYEQVYNHSYELDEENGESGNENKNDEENNETKE